MTKPTPAFVLAIILLACMVLVFIVIQTVHNHYIEKQAEAIMRTCKTIGNVDVPCE